MNNRIEEARKMVKNTFENPFDKDRFRYFAKNLLNRIDESAFVYRGNTVPHNYGSHIKTLERIGKYIDPEGNKIDVLIVRLKKEKSLERARTMQRDLIARYLNGSRGGELKEAALVAFVSPDQNDWRFSLVKMDYKLVETPSGNVKAKEEFTPARRWSFLVGKNEKSHTAQSRLIDIFIDDVNDPSLSQLEEAFDIEKVTKEFFEKYRGLYIRLTESLTAIVKKDPKIKKDFDEKSVEIPNFTKKLLGQIIFLYFLQKKGWFGVEKNSDWGTGPKDFLRLLFEKKITKYKNFFNDMLEPLFYEALARERDKDFYSYFNCKIPFLNGGLFEPMNDYDWVHTDINIANELFSNDNLTKEGDIGDGILDIFDRYNFTVKEDEPLEKEVAVDPEMLGKVFENLLVVKDRKSKGTYYTPREIVHYMCHESLINYLKTETKIDEERIRKLVTRDIFLTKEDVYKWKKEKKTPSNKVLVFWEGEYQELDEALKNIRVVDPACGSGAFLVGMLQEIVRARKLLQLFGLKNQSEYFLKEEAIQNCIYGVDIDPGAVEIAKLRLWLSLVVEEEDIKQIRPLPNLDYKIMQGNSLLEEFEGVNLFDEKLLKEQVKSSDDTERLRKLIEKEAEIAGKLLKYYEQNPKLLKNKKIERPIEVFQLEAELKKIQYNIKHETEMMRIDTRTQMNGRLHFGDYSGRSEVIGEELKKLHDKFFKSSSGSEKNELKKEIERLEWSLIEETLKEQNKKSALRKLEKYKKDKIKPFFLWKLNFGEVFQEKGGFDVIIANPPYVKEYVNKSAFYGLKNSPYYKGKMDLWYLFACHSIDLAKNSSGIVTFIAQNNWVTSHGASKMRNKVINDSQILSMIDFGDYKIFETAGIQTMVMIFKKDSSKEYYTFDFRRLNGQNLKFYDLISILAKTENTNAEYFNPKIIRADFIDKKLTFGNSDTEKILNKMFLRINFKLNPTKEVAQGIVYPQDYVNKASQKILGRNFKVGDGIFVLSNVEKEKINFDQQELKLIKPLYTTKELTRWHGNHKNKEWVIYTDSTFRNKKKIENYPKIKKHLDQFEKVITSDNKPYGLHRSRDDFFFKGEKIISARKCAKPTFTYVNFDSYLSATFYVIKTERVNQKYLVGLLNSELLSFWLRYRGKMQGNNYQIDKEPIIDLPILKSSDREQQEIIKIVDKILAITKSGDYSENPEKQAKVKEYEKQIDQMVYKLYDLTKDEIKIVEENR